MAVGTKWHPGPKIYCGDMWRNRARHKRPSLLPFLLQRQTCNLKTKSLQLKYRKIQIYQVIFFALVDFLSCVYMDNMLPAFISRLVLPPGRMYVYPRSFSDTSKPLNLTSGSSSSLSCFCFLWNRPLSMVPLCSIRFSFSINVRFSPLGIQSC